MLGLETVQAQIDRAAAIERRVASGPAPEVLREARAAYAAATAELQRDQAELDKLVQGAGGTPSFDPAHAYGQLARAGALTDAQQEVAADRTAIARLAESLRVLNQRVDADSYMPIDERSARLEAAKLDVDHVVLLASTSNDARALELYNQYLPGQYVTAAEATTLALMSTDAPADVARLNDDFFTLLERAGTTQPTAALLASLRDVEGSYARFQTFRSSGLTPDVAALLATTGKPDAKALFEAVRGTDVPERYAALLSAAAAEAGTTREATLAMLRYFSEGRPPYAAAMLTAITIASAREPDGVAAAQSRFIRAGYGRPDLATAAWALSGRSSPTMAGIATIIELERRDQAYDPQH